MHYVPWAVLPLWSSTNADKLFPLVLSLDEDGDYDSAQKSETISNYFGGLDQQIILSIWSTNGSELIDESHLQKQFWEKWIQISKNHPLSFE